MLHVGNIAILSQIHVAILSHEMILSFYAGKNEGSHYFKLLYFGICHVGGGLWMRLVIV